MSKDWLLHIKLGIEAPKKEPASANEMRQAILEASRDSALINRCLIHAEHSGMSGEDKYVGLAYYALRELERLWKLQQERNACQISHAIILKEEAP